jgi:hypothetical protein
MPGLLDPTELMQPGMGASQYVANPNFTASLAPPQMVANPRAGYGNWQAPQQAPASPLSQPTLGGGLTHDDVQKALGMLYGQLGGGVDWVKYTGGANGLLGQAPTAGQPGGQQPGGGAQNLVDAYQGFKQFDDINKQIQQAKALYDNPDGGYHGREGGGIV